MMGTKDINNAVRKITEKMRSKFRNRYGFDLAETIREPNPCPFCGSYRRNHTRGRGVELCVTPKRGGLE